MNIENLITPKQNKKTDWELVNCVVAHLRNDRSLFLHGCMISPNPSYGDLNAIAIFFKHYDSLAQRLMQDDFEVTEWNTMLEMYRIQVCIRILNGWVEIINKDSICKNDITCNVCAIPHVHQ